MKPIMISNNNGDIENNGGGDTNNSQNPLPTYIMKRLLFISCLSIGVSYMILGRSNIELQTMKDRVESAYSYLKYDKSYKREEDYEPLIGSMGEIFEESPWDSNKVSINNNNNNYDTEYNREDGSGSYDEISLWERMGEIFESNDDDNIEDRKVEPIHTETKTTIISEDKKHPRVRCFMDDYNNK